MAIVINFTHNAEPVSDFDAEGEVEHTLSLIRIYADSELTKTICICNVLVFNLLRADLLNSELKHSVSWQWESMPIDMDENMRSEKFWSFPEAELWDKALNKTHVPNTL